MRERRTFSRLVRACALLILAWVALARGASPTRAAEATTGIILGTVASANSQPLLGVRISAVSGSGRASTTTDARGRFAILGLTPDSYAVSAESAGYEAVVERGITVLAGQTQTTSFHLEKELRTIGTVRAASKAFALGSTSDTFTVSGEAARALSPPVSSSGLANYTAGSVQGAIASVPGVDLDAFANAIFRGGKIDDAVFSYDSVPIPQGLVANPGGNVVGAQLPTTGIGSTSVTLAGYQTQGDNALGGVVDQIPSVGKYPGSTKLELADGVGTQYQLASLQTLGATPDLRWRYALASTAASEYFSYGDGQTFYPSEAATYGVALQNRGQYSVSSNVHYRLTPSDDLSLLALVGEASYDQYGTPYAGELYGALNGATTTFPGQVDPNAQVTTPSRVRGTYDILKAQWLHTGAHSLSRVQLYQSQFGSTAGGPYWDENGFPSGAVSLFTRQGGREEGLGYDGEDVIGDRHHLRYGAEYRVNNSFLDQVVPTAGEVIHSNPTLFSFLTYLGETFSASKRLDLTGTARLSGTHIVPSFGSTYGIAALDPHFGLAYRIGARYALRATFDHTTVAPKPLEADRTDSTNVDPATMQRAPFVPLNPERANDFTYAFEGGGKTQFRATYFEKYERDRIDVLPFNFRTAVSSGLAPGGVGVPTNVGRSRARGAELWIENGGFTFRGNLIHAQSSSASQFSYNDLNAPAIAVGHLFPIGYVPDFTSTLSYEFQTAHRRVRVTPSLSFQTGYPYGNGRMVYVFDSVTHEPVHVLNDNFVNPGANYYFLRDPSRPFDATSNPYVGNLGTPEGADPNTLRSPPQTLVNLHVEGDVSHRLTAVVDVVNLLGNFSPNAYQNNPYLIGPPGYAGGNPLYAAAYQNAGGFAKPYELGNGVPTNDGVTQVVPWTYGRGGYVPQGYPLGRTVQVRLRYQL